MTQPTTIEVNGVSALENGADGHIVAPPGKRKRDSSEESEPVANGDNARDVKPSDAREEWAQKDQRQLIRSYFEVLKGVDIKAPILKRPLQDAPTENEPQTKRQKSTEPSPSTISDKVAADAYSHIKEIATDIIKSVKSALADIESDDSDDDKDQESEKITTAEQIRAFGQRAMELFEREKAYPNNSTVDTSVLKSVGSKGEQGEMILSLIGNAPQERRLFSSLPLSQDIDISEPALPTGMSVTRVLPSRPQERSQTLGELFGPPRPLPPLQPPLQPKNQAKGNTLDFYHPELTDHSKHHSNAYFTAKLSSGTYLDYSNATPSSQIKTKRRERAQSLAGKKPSAGELELSEMESLFRGAFSSFAPCKDDTAALVPSNVAGRMWWQRSGQRNFQQMIEVEYYEDAKHDSLDNGVVEIDEAAIQEAIDNWDDAVVDPSLSDVMGRGDEVEEKEADEILDEVSDMIETLASYQRIRNLTLPNSQNRHSSDPVTGDMLANPAPQPSEEELATYQMLKAQLTLIIKTLPPYAVSKLNGDQLDELLVSTKVPVQTENYKGTMEEDDAGIQARWRAQQAAAQATARPAQRTPSMSGASYNHYTPGNHYGTPSRSVSQPQQFYRQGASPYQQRANLPPSTNQRPPQPNQYSRPNGYSNQYATQLAKTQTPFGHQNMPQYNSQQRPQYGQMPQGTPGANTGARFAYQQTYQGSPAQANFAQYTNGSPAPQRTASPQISNRAPYTPTPNSQQQGQRWGQPTPSMSSQMNRFSSNQGPGLTGYHTVIPEAQQQRILEQAKARVAAQERSASFTDKISQPGTGISGLSNLQGLAAARASMGNQGRTGSPLNGAAAVAAQVPRKVTPVPVPPIPGSQPQGNASS